MNAVKAENAKGKTLNQIKKKDAEWKATPGIAEYMKAIIESDCGQYLRNIMDGSNLYSEIFVMDNQGANVAMTDKTSDYWQGDEAKFKKSYNGGQGDIFVDNVEFDDSSQTYLSQVSVPVKDGGTVIGAITFGSQKFVAEVNPALCKGCGAYAAVCPSEAPALMGFDNNQIYAQIKGALSF